MEDPNKVKIFVSTYNKEVPVKGNVYVPIQVGKKVSGIDLGYLGDDTGDNISEMNHYYSEQSGVYWVWKNLENHPEYVGFCHYRKYPLFDKRIDLRSIRTGYNFTDFPTNAEWFNLDYSYNDVLEIINGVDVVAINPFRYCCPLESMYRKIQISGDFDLLKEAVHNVYPEYDESFKITLCTAPGYLIPYNTYVMKWDLFDKYCKFIFGIFEYLDKKIDYAIHTGYHTRVFGYMAEDLFTLFISHNKPAIRYVPCALLMEFFDGPVHGK